MKKIKTNDHKADWLLEFNLDTIVAAKPHLANWAAAKRLEMRDADRLEIMKWMAFGLDRGNKAIMASRLGITMRDIDGLKNIFSSLHFP